MSSIPEARLPADDKRRRRLLINAASLGIELGTRELPAQAAPIVPGLGSVPDDFLEIA